MSYRKKLLRVISLPILAVLLASCTTVSKDVEDDVVVNPENNYLRVEFYNYDSAFLYSNYLTEGTYILKDIYKASAPIRSDDETFQYTFAGWENEGTQLSIESSVYISKDISFTAYYSKEEIIYYTVSFVNYDGTELYKTKVRAGGDATYEGVLPARPDDDNGNTYTFIGWSGDTNNIQDDKTFVANFSSKKRKQTVRFLNYDETILDIQSVFYGDTVTYTGEKPTRPDEGAYTYTFSGWDKVLTNIIEDTDIHAQYTSDTRSLIVSFVNYDGSLLYETTVEYGEDVTYEGPTPTRPPEGRNAFVFDGWSGSLENIVGNIELRALYSKTDRGASAGLSFYYNATDEGYVVSGYTGSEAEVFVPKTYDDGFNGEHKVIRIASRAFANKLFTSIFLEDNVQYIDDEAFSYCNRLSSIHVSNLLRGLGQNIFRGCNNLLSINLPSTLDSIDRYSFNDYSNYKTAIKISAKNPYYSVDDNGFLYNRDKSLLYFPLNRNDTLSTKTLTIADGVKEIASNAFSNYYNLTKVTFPDSMEKINMNAFNNCNSLATINIPENLQFIGENAFNYCNNLYGTLTFPSALSVIDQGAFQNCSKITKLVFDDSPCEIRNSAFYYCNSIATIEFGNEIKRLNYGAFQYCQKIKSVSLPATLESLDYYAFGECSSLEEINVSRDNTTYISIDGVVFAHDLSSVIITPPAKKGAFHIDADFDGEINTNVFRNINTDSFEVDENNANYCSVGGVIYSKDKKEMIAAPQNIKEIVAPEELETINNGAIDQRYNLETVDLSASKIETIPGQAFNNCNNLTEVKLPASLKNIYYNAFQSCMSLTTVDLPSSLESIGYYAFAWCNALEKIDIPSGVTRIEYRAFQGCTSLKSIEIPDSVTDLNTSGLFYGCSSLESVKLPSGLTSLSNETFRSCTSLKTIELPENITSINSYAFEYCTSLEEITLPSKLTNLYYRALANCTSLKEIVLPDKLSYMDSYVFSGCSALETINIPDSMRTINEGEFQYCSSLKKIVFPSTINYFYTYQLFDGCSSLEEITFPTCEFNIGYRMFANCTKLKTFDVPTSATSINGYAFYGCSSLESIDIPSSVTNIYSQAFEGCSSLTSVLIPSTVTYLETYRLFADCTSLTMVDILSTAVSSVGESMFYNCSSLMSITFANSITSYGMMAFYGCTSLENYAISNSTMSVGNQAFYNVKSVVLPANLSGISGFSPDTFTGSTIFYEGTSSQWSSLLIYYYKKVYYYSETEPTESDKYWHYNESGAPTIWEIEAN